MTHSDDDGLVLPPHVAPVQVVILPIVRNDTKNKVLSYCHELKEKLSSKLFGDYKIRVTVDDRNIRGGEKAWGWIKKGVPIRIEIGMNEIESATLQINRRDRAPNDKTAYNCDEFVEKVSELLTDIHANLLERAKQYRKSLSTVVNSEAELRDFFDLKGTGFAYGHWCGDSKFEQAMKEKLGISIRCLPLSETEAGRCIFTGKPSKQRLIWAKSY